MKKVYIVPAMEIEEAEMAQNLMLTVSTGAPFGEGESATADAIERNLFTDEDIELW